MSWPGTSHWVGTEHELEMRCRGRGSSCPNSPSLGGRSARTPARTLTSPRSERPLFATSCRRRAPSSRIVSAVRAARWRTRTATTTSGWWRPTEVAGYRGRALPAQAMASHRLRVQRVGRSPRRVRRRHRAKVSPIVRRARETGLLDPPCDAYVAPDAARRKSGGPLERRLERRRRRTLAAGAHERLRQITIAVHAQDRVGRRVGVTRGDEDGGLARRGRHAPDGGRDDRDAGRHASKSTWGRPSVQETCRKTSAVRYTSMRPSSTGT